MGFTNFPNGVFSLGVPVMPSGLPFSSNSKVFFVNSSGGSDGHRGTDIKRPLGTLDGAIGKCTADSGDVIIVLPNHSETVEGAGGITFDVAGISVFGIGQGSQRPRILMDGGTSVTAVVSAADVHIENLVFAGGHNGIVTCFDIDAANFTAKDIEFEDNTTDEHFIIAFTVGSATDNTCDGLTIVGCRWYTLDTGVTHFIDLTGDCDNVTITDNFYCADAATGAQLLSQAAGDDIQGLQFLRNTLITGATSGDLLIENDQTDNTGIAAYNLAGHHDTAGSVIIDCDGIRQFENYHTSSDTESGVLQPAADTNT